MGRFKITFKSGVEELGRVYSKEVQLPLFDKLQLASHFEDLIAAEHLVEKVTGLRCHIDFVQTEPEPPSTRLKSKRTRRARCAARAAGRRGAKCQNLLKSKDRGRPRKFCSNACRIRSFADKKSQEIR